MPKRRKLMVKEAFKRLSDHCGGYVTIGDVRAVSPLHVSICIPPKRSIAQSKRSVCAEGGIDFLQI